MSQVLCKRGKTPFRRDSLTGICYIYVVGPNGTLTTSTTLDKPLLSFEDMTGVIVFEVREVPARLSDYWQQRTKSQLCHVHVAPRKTLFTPAHAAVDVAALAPCRETHMSHFSGSCATLSDT